MINKGTQRQNYIRLLEYDEDGRSRMADTSKKLTVNLEFSYFDLIQRLAIIEGSNKTAIVRRAIDYYASQFDDDSLFPRSGYDDERSPVFAARCAQAVGHDTD